MEARPTTATPSPIDPAKQFGTPEDLLNHKRLSSTQKTKILEQWKYDLTLMQTANDENMQKETADQAGAKGETPGSQGKSADLLQRVNNCLTELAAAGSDAKKPH